MNSYIKNCIDRKNKVAVYMLNGFQMRGVIVADGDSHIIIKCNGVDKMLYKHAISTIEPA